MKAANQRVDLIDTGDLLAVPHNIDYSAVAAASDDNQTSIGFINQHSFIGDVIRGLLGIFNNAVGFGAATSISPDQMNRSLICTGVRVSSMAWRE